MMLWKAHRRSSLLIGGVAGEAPFEIGQRGRFFGEALEVDYRVGHERQASLPVHFGLSNKR